jgi:predicted hydrocarbon binding protein
LGKEKEPPLSYRVDSETGIVTGAVLDSRVVVFGSYGWATIEAELDSTFVTGGSVILYRMGFSYGKYLGLVVKRRAAKSDPTAKAVDLLIRVAKDSGWGDFVLNGGALSQGVLRLVVRDCLFCVHLNKGTEARCHFLSGVAAGLADEVTGASHTSREERCIAKGDNVCEIVVERTAAGAPV